MKVETNHSTHFKMKKAISPLIGWVLLVGFAVVMGAIVTNWTINHVRDLPVGETQQKEIYCDNVRLGVNTCRYHDDTLLNLDIENKGKYTVKSLVIHRRTGDSPTGYCYALNLNIAPQDFGSYQLSLGDDLDEEKVVDCDSLDATSDPVEVAEIGVVPIISIDDEDYRCSESKTTITNFAQLNGHCECSDGIDNDNNGCSDHPEDGGCYASYDTEESGGECTG